MKDRWEVVQVVGEGYRDTVERHLDAQAWATCLRDCARKYVGKYVERWGGDGINEGYTGRICISFPKNPSSNSMSSSSGKTSSSPMWRAGRVGWDAMIECGHHGGSCSHEPEAGDRVVLPSEQVKEGVGGHNGCGSSGRLDCSGGRWKTDSSGKTSYGYEGRSRRREK